MKWISTIKKIGPKAISPEDRVVILFGESANEELADVSVIQEFDADTPAASIVLKKGDTITIDGITSVAVNGQDLGFSGYLDIGLYDTMEDLFVNFIGATVFSVIGYFYLKRRGGGRFAAAFIPTLEETEKEADADDGNSPAQTSDPDVS